jgi:hypothetical protein
MGEPKSWRNLHNRRNPQISTFAWTGIGAGLVVGLQQALDCGGTTPLSVCVARRAESSY